ncbi:hypothetical protein NPIL_126141 [Nephila pilipes]|uniref:Uncharacterized protein n=1 Tax=Nephila pilipes TaxID=299642 RepID=A0A8X6MSD3_NEPPI|nr:hypothetical protein NPIL_126141 [Nephila pilipes]
MLSSSLFHNSPKTGMGSDGSRPIFNDVCSHPLTSKAGSSQYVLRLFNKSIQASSVELDKRTYASDSYARLVWFAMETKGEPTTRCVTAV